MGFQNKIKEFHTLITKNVYFLVGYFFNRHRIQYESGALNTNILQILQIFLPSITDCVGEINKHMGWVILLPIDISGESFELDGILFNPSKLDYDNPDKEKMTQAVVKML